MFQRLRETLWILDCIILRCVFFGNSGIGHCDSDAQCLLMRMFLFRFQKILADAYDCGDCSRRCNHFLSRYCHLASHGGTKRQMYVYCNHSSHCFNCYHVYRGNKDSFIHSIIAHYSYTPLVAWLSGNALVSFNVSILYAGPATSCKLCDQLRVAWI